MSDLARTSPPDPEPAGPRGGLAGAAAVMFSGTFVSRLLGLVRTMVLVVAIAATGGAADAFAVANTLPNTIYMLLAGGVLNAILVPQIVRAMRQADGGQEYVDRLLTVAGIGLFLLTVALTAGSTLLVLLYGSRLDAAWLPIAFAFAMWCVPQLFFYGMYTLLGQVLNARSVFGPYMWAPAVNNVIAITGLLVYLAVFGRFDAANPQPAEAWGAGRIALLAGSATLGVVAQALILVVPLWRSGFRWRPRWGVRGLGSASNVAMWAFAALGVGQLGYLAVANVGAAASGAGGGQDPTVAGNAAYGLAFMVFMLPQSLITVSLVTALFTRVSDSAARGDGAAVRSDMSLGVRTVGVFTVFASGAMMVLALPLTQIIAVGETFEGQRAIAHVLVALLGGLSALGVWTTVQRVYYAYEDARSLFFIQIPMAAIVVVGSLASALLFDPQWWVAGAAASMTVSTIVGSLIGYLALRRRLPSLDGSRILITHLRLVMATAPAVLLGWGLLSLLGPRSGLGGSALRVLLVGLLMAAVYLLLLRALRVSEVEVLLARVRPALTAAGRRVRTIAARGASNPGSARAGSGGGPTVSTTTGGIRRGSLVADRYRIDEPLTAETLGARRWRGTDQILQRSVEAVTFGGDAVPETLDAARRAALIDDPRIAKVLRAGEHAGEGFVVTASRSWATLVELTASGPLSPAEARSLVGELASALEAARRRGMHHLVLRPSVVGITEDGDGYLTGLGLEAAVAGIPQNDPRLTARCDAIDLLRLLYFSLTGAWPSVATDLSRSSEGFDLDAAALPPAPVGEDGHPVAASQLNPDVPPDLDSLLQLTLGPVHAGPSTPAEVVRQLAPWHELQPLASRPAPSRSRAAVVPPGQGTSSVDGPSGPDTLDGPVDSDAPADDAEATTKEGAADGPASSTRVIAAVVHPERDPSRLTTTQWQPPPRPGQREPMELENDADSPAEAPFEELIRPEPIAPAGPIRHPRPGPGGLAELGATAAAVGTVVQESASRLATASTTALKRANTSIRATVAERAAVREARAEARASAQAEADAPTDAEAQTRMMVAAPPAEAAPSDRLVSAPPTEPSPVDSRREPRTRPWGSGNATAPYPVSDVASREPEEIALPQASDADVAPARSHGQFNPTPVVLTLVIVGVIVVFWMAIRSIMSVEGWDFNGSDRTPAAQTQTLDGDGQGSEGDNSDDSDLSALPAPQISQVRSIDPSAEQGDNEDQAGNAIDGDPQTWWSSLAYQSPSYGMKDGLAIELVLAERSLVSSVMVDVRGTGGLVQVRATTGADPGGGELLAEGPMGPSVVFDLDEPVEAETLVLWFPELPQSSSDGRNRIELVEVVLQ